MWSGKVKSASLAAVLAVAVHAATEAEQAAPPAPEVADIRFGPPIWSRTSMGAAYVLFQDGAQSIAVEGGSLWMFGDTFLGEQRSEHANDPPAKEHQPEFAGAISMSAAFLRRGETSTPPRLEYYVGADGRAASPMSLFTDEPSERLRIWPAGGIAIGRRIHLFYKMIETTADPGPMNFRGAGQGLAVAERPLAPFHRIAPGGDWHFPIAPSQVVRDRDLLYLYIVGDGEAPGPKGLLLGRVAVDRIEDPSAYEFFAGANRWTKDRRESAVVVADVAGQASVMRMPHGAAHPWLLVQSADFFHPHEIRLRTADAPWGPWSEPARIDVPEHSGKTTDLIYGSYLHPEWTSSRGKGVDVALTFCRMLHGDMEWSNPETVRVLVK